MREYRQVDDRSTPTSFSEPSCRKHKHQGLEVGSTSGDYERELEASLCGVTIFFLEVQDTVERYSHSKKVVT